ncbi:MAG: excinuclease ABC subunit UvrC [bacterium]
MDLQEKLKNLPDSPGAYIMKDRKGRIIYVGKALSLKKRVRSYFGSSGASSAKIAALISTISDLEYIVTATEKEALLIEFSLIKKHKPRYNTDYKDDKRYPFLKLTMSEEFPRLVMVRIPRDDGGRYYGPYPDGTSLKTALGTLRRIFPLRTCRGAKLPDRICLDYHIRRCLGPCIKKVTKGVYCGIINEMDLFLRGEHKKLFELLGDKMAKAANKLHYEEAARIRNEIAALGRLTQRIRFRQIKKESFLRDIYKKGSARRKIADLRKKLGLKKTPMVIEAFDISNIGGKQAVGSMVVFVRGEAAKALYRRFRIKTVKEIDDYLMMQEIVRRRYSRLLKEGLGMPELVLIDGGKGQVNAVLEVLSDLGLKGANVIGIAKKSEHIFVPFKKEPVILERTCDALHLLQQVRDEAHRFAINYHRKLRSKIK